MSRRDESGTIAVVVAVLAIAIMGMAAFVVDIGAAYANKRQLQTAADAAALGAAGVFANQQFRQCADMHSNGLTDATNEAQSKVLAHKTDLSPGNLTQFTASCEGGDLVVRTTVTANSPNIFGRVAGPDTDYTVFRSAAAVVEASVTGPRLRPMALCASDLPAMAVPGTPFQLSAPGDAPGWTSTSCPQPDNSGAGNWWTLDCPNEGDVDGNGNAALADQIKNGCGSPISIVPDQGTKTGVALNNHLAAKCPSTLTTTTMPSYCLGGDPGQPDSGQVPQAWKDLINSERVVPIPVFCTNPNPAIPGSSGLCDHSSVQGNGTNAVFPVHKLVGVQVCGFHFGKQNKSRYPSPSQPLAITSCPEADAMLDDLRTDNGDRMYLVLIARNLQISNVTADSACDLGDDRCDGGIRQVRMVSGDFTY